MSNFSEYVKISDTLNPLECDFSLSPGDKSFLMGYGEVEIHSIKTNISYVVKRGFFGKLKKVNSTIDTIVVFSYLNQGCPSATSLPMKEFLENDMRYNKFKLRVENLNKKLKSE